MAFDFSAVDIAVGIVKKEEGLRLAPYLCPAGYWTVGYGHRCAVGSGSISEATALQLLRDDCEAAKAAANISGLTVGQHAAIISLVMNIGGSAFLRSTLRRKIIAGDLQGAAHEFGRWIHVTKDGAMVVSNGLVSRRGRERFLFERDIAGGEK